MWKSMLVYMPGVQNERWAQEEKKHGRHNTANLDKMWSQASRICKSGIYKIFNVK